MGLSVQDLMRSCSGITVLGEGSARLMGTWSFMSKGLRGFRFIGSRFKSGHFASHVVLICFVYHSVLCS